MCMCESFVNILSHSCGYVYTPKYMRDPGYDPLDIKTFSDLNALAITLTVSLGQPFIHVQVITFVYPSRLLAVDILCDRAKVPSPRCL